ncbi:hypothetical protein O1L60_03230 [Streptomyces diastatochromogenes]|nr:hypothetical protein [Streptomyces diastatochromogenes]
MVLPGRPRRDPQLSRYRRGRDCRQQPDLRLLYHWMHQAGCASPTASRSASRPARPGTAVGDAARLVVHRVVSDQHGHALEITDIDFSARSAAWTYEFSA